MYILWDGDFMEKKEIRKIMKQRRESLSLDERKILDQKAANKLLEAEDYKNATNIFAFVNFGSEIDTRFIIERALEEGKNIFIPYTEEGSKFMKLTRLKSLDKLVEGQYGILSPKEEDLDFVDGSIIDLVIVPGLAFNKEGYRTGYGGGYYDRFFSSLKKPVKKVGYCYSFQILDSLEIGEFDIPVDTIITD